MTPHSEAQRFSAARDAHGMARRLAAALRPGHRPLRRTRRWYEPGFRASVLYQHDSDLSEVTC